MSSDLYFEGKKFISSNRAAKITGYVNDYIGQLCRDGKLVSRMVGRSWYVSLDSLLEHKNATGNGIKSRSQRHIKKVTLLEPELLREERAEIGSRDSQNFEGESVPINKIFSATNDTNVSAIFTKSDDVLSNVLGVTEALKVKFPSEVWGKENTPFDFHVLKKAWIYEDKTKEHKKYLAYMFPRVVSGVLSLFVALAGFWFALNVNSEVELAYSNIFHSVQEKQNIILAQAGDTLEASVFSGIYPVIDRAGIAVYRTINGWIFKTQRRILVMVGREPHTETVYQTELDSTKPNQGMVVVPVNDNTNRAAVVAKIKNSFSDEVSVKPDSDNASGVITPVFKKAKGDDYLYVLVPIKN